MKKGYKECHFCGEKIKKEAKKCRYCGEFLEDKLDKNDSKKDPVVTKNFTQKIWRFIVFMYFFITIPTFISLCGKVIVDYSEIYKTHYFYNYYTIILLSILYIMLYIVITDIIRRICSFVSNGSFKGIINYRKLFIKGWPYIIILICVLGGLNYLSKEKAEKINNACNGIGMITNEDLTCSCDNGYSEIDGKCERVISFEEAVNNYIKDHGLSIKKSYYLDYEFINSTDGVALLIDVDGQWPQETTAKYADFVNCYQEVEGITSVTGQAYVISYEKDGTNFKINDFYKVPNVYSSYFGSVSSLTYPILGTKESNYNRYGGEEPKTEDEKSLLQKTKILKMRDLDGDGKFLEFLLINHFDLSCGYNNYLILGYNPDTKKIYNFRGEFGGWITIDFYAGYDSWNDMYKTILKMKTK